MVALTARAWCKATLHGGKRRRAEAREYGASHIFREYGASHIFRSAAKVHNEEVNVGLP